MDEETWSRERADAYRRSRGLGVALTGLALFVLLGVATVFGLAVVALMIGTDR